LVSACLLVLLSALVSPDTSHGELSQTQEQTLQRLVEISTQLEEANARLRQALQESRSSYNRLETLYAQAESELTHLSESLARAEQSLTASELESKQLGTHLVKVRHSLRNLKSNLADLENRIARLRLERWLWLLGGLAGGFGIGQLF
jgi:chromosome segregation ATPase